MHPQYIVLYFVSIILVIMLVLWILTMCNKMIFKWRIDNTQILEIPVEFVENAEQKSVYKNDSPPSYEEHMKSLIV